MNHPADDFEWQHEIIRLMFEEYETGENNRIMTHIRMRCDPSTQLRMGRELGYSSSRICQLEDLPLTEIPERVIEGYLKVAGISLGTEFHEFLLFLGKKPLYLDRSPSNPNRRKARFRQVIANNSIVDVTNPNDHEIIGRALQYVLEGDWRAQVRFLIKLIASFNGQALLPPSPNPTDQQILRRYVIQVDSARPPEEQAEEAPVPTKRTCRKTDEAGAQ